jgi:hypothetical protein
MQSMIILHYFKAIISLVLKVNTLLNEQVLLRVGRQDESGMRARPF